MREGGGREEEEGGKEAASKKQNLHQGVRNKFQLILFVSGSHTNRRSGDSPLFRQVGVLLPMGVELLG